MLTRPLHVHTANLAVKPLDFPWDEWKVEEAYQPADKDLIARLSPISFRGLVGLTIATAEWVVWRFKGMDKEPGPFDFALNYLEACWAGNVHMAYQRYIETDDDDWRGVARGPLNIAITMIVDLMYDWQHHDRPEEYPAWMTNLATLVIPDHARDNFAQWQDASIKRLEEHFPAPEVEIDEFGDVEGDEDPRGDFVPREVFNWGFPFDPTKSHELVDRFLRGLRPDDNPCLHKPGEMEEFEDWEGMPYQL